MRELFSILVWIALALLPIAIAYRIILYFKVARRQRDAIIRLLGGDESVTSKHMSTWTEPKSKPSSSVAAAHQRTISIRKV